MNINRDYIINITLLEAPTKGKITIPKDIVFYEKIVSQYLVETEKSIVMDYERNVHE